MNYFKDIFERSAFGVCSYLGEKMGIASARVRVYFIYISFVTVGLSFGLYLTLAFLLRLKDMIYTKRSSVFDL